MHKDWIQALEQVLNRTGSLQEFAHISGYSVKTLHSHWHTIMPKSNPSYLTDQTMVECLQTIESPTVRMLRDVLQIPYRDFAIYIDSSLETSYLDYIKSILSAPQFMVLNLTYDLSYEHDIPTCSTLREVAEIMNLSRERIRQIKTKALYILRRPDNLQHLFPDYLQLIHQLQEVTPITKQMEKMYMDKRYELESLLALQSEYSENIAKIQAFIDELNQKDSDHLITHTSLDDMQLSTRTYNNLRIRLQCKTLADVIQHTVEEINNTPYCGKKTVNELRTVLWEQYRLTLKDDNPPSYTSKGI